MGVVYDEATLLTLGGVIPMPAAADGPKVLPFSTLSLDLCSKHGRGGGGTQGEGKGLTCERSGAVALEIHGYKTKTVTPCSSHFLSCF